jgi:hypothetical protein
VPTDRSYTRYWVNGGHAWIARGLTYPPLWLVEIPTGSASVRSEEVSSLDAALRVASNHGLELDVDDWTYDLMVKEGLAPKARPEHALRPQGACPGAGPGDYDVRPVGFAILQHAPDFMGLTAAAATALAQELAVDVRLVDEHTEAITADWAPSRLNLRLENERVVGASMG